MDGKDAQNPVHSVLHRGVGRATFLDTLAAHP